MSTKLPRPIAQPSSHKSTCTIRPIRPIRPIAQPSNITTVLFCRFIIFHFWHCFKFIFNVFSTFFLARIIIKTITFLTRCIMANITEWAIGKWANRASLNYKPICDPVGGSRIDPYGRKKTDHEYNKGPRRYFKSETTDADVTYVMYDNDTHNDVPIIRLTEV